MTAVAALLGAIISWGMIPVMLRYLAVPAKVPDGFTSNLARYPIAAIACLPWLIWGIRRGELRGLWPWLRSLRRIRTIFGMKSGHNPRFRGRQA